MPPNKIPAALRASIFGQPGHVERDAYLTPWGVPTQCHELILPLFRDACEEAVLLPWDPQRIDSYNPRPIRGEDGDELDEWSLHAWCLAWDFFVTPPNVPPPGGVWTPHNGVPEAFARCFTRRGFRWGGDWTSRRDVPHIEWAGGTPPPLTDEELSMADIRIILDRLDAIELRVIDVERQVPNNLNDQLGEIRRNLRRDCEASGVPPGDIEA